MERSWGGGLFHGQHYKETEEIPLHLIRNHRNICTKTHVLKKKKKNAHLYTHTKLETPLPRHTTKINTHQNALICSCKCRHLLAEMCTQKATQRERTKTHTQAAAAVLCLLSLSPWGAPVSSFFLRGTFIILPLSILCLLFPILFFFWGWGCFVGGPSEPQSGGLSPGGGGKQAWIPPPGAGSSQFCLRRCGVSVL